MLGFEAFGVRDTESISAIVGSRRPDQVRNHYRKYMKKLQRLVARKECYDVDIINLFKSLQEKRPLDSMDVYCILPCLVETNLGVVSVLFVKDPKIILLSGYSEEESENLSAKLVRDKYEAEEMNSMQGDGILPKNKNRRDLPMGIKKNVSGEDWKAAHESNHGDRNRTGMSKSELKDLLTSLKVGNSDMSMLPAIPSTPNNGATSSQKLLTTILDDSSLSTSSFARSGTSNSLRSQRERADAFGIGSSPRIRSLPNTLKHESSGSAGSNSNLSSVPLSRLVHLSAENIAIPPSQAARGSSGKEEGSRFTSELFAVLSGVTEGSIDALRVESSGED